MRYNREDIRDKLIQKCFPAEQHNNDRSSLYQSRAQYSHSRDSTISNTPLFHPQQATFKKQEPSLSRSRVDVQPVTFKRASSLVSLTRPSIENSRFNYISSNYVQQPQYLLPRVPSYQSIQPVQQKPIMRNDFLSTILPKGFEPRSSIVVREITRTPILKPMSQVSSTSIQKGVKSNSQASITNITTNIDSLSRATPTIPTSPIFKQVKQPQKISMRGVTIRRQLNNNVLLSPTPMCSAKSIPPSYFQLQRAHSPLPKQSLDGILSQICGGMTNCAAGEENFTVEKKKGGTFGRTQNNFRRTSSNWKYLP